MKGTLLWCYPKGFSHPAAWEFPACHPNPGTCWWWKSGSQFLGDFKHSRSTFLLPNQAGKPYVQSWKPPNFQGNKASKQGKIGKKMSFLFCVHQFWWKNLRKRDFSHTNHHLSTFSTHNCHFYLFKHKVLRLKTTLWRWECFPLE